MDGGSGGGETEIDIRRSSTAIISVSVGAAVRDDTAEFLGKEE